MRVATDSETGKLNHSTALISGNRISNQFLQATQKLPAAKPMTAQTARSVLATPLRLSSLPFVNWAGDMTTRAEVTRSRTGQQCVGRRKIASRFSFVPTKSRRRLTAMAGLFSLKASRLDVQQH